MTTEALEGSIKKWEAIVAGTGSDLGTKNCPLCQVYFDNGDCSGCPVERKTGLCGCAGTPWDDWVELAHGPYPWDVRADTPEKMAAAEAELAFLKSLR